MPFLQRQSMKWVGWALSPAALMAYVVTFDNTLQGQLVVHPRMLAQREVS